MCTCRESGPGPVASPWLLSPKATCCSCALAGLLTYPPARAPSRQHIAVSGFVPWPLAGNHSSGYCSRLSRLSLFIRRRRKPIRTKCNPLFSKGTVLHFLYLTIYQPPFANGTKKPVFSSAGIGKCNCVLVFSNCFPISIHRFFLRAINAQIPLKTS
jgi:hypothetical protein